MNHRQKGEKMTEVKQNQNEEVRSMVAKTIKGKVLRRYFKSVCKHDFVARYRIDANTDYNVCWIEDGASYETKKQFLQDNGFSKSRSITAVPTADQLSERNFAKQIFFSPLGEETLEKPVYEQRISSLEKFKVRKQRVSTGKRGRKGQSVESFDKWVAKVKPENVKKDQVKLGMKKLHGRYENWCKKNEMEVINYDKFWVVMKKNGLHTTTRAAKTAAVAPAVEAVG